MIGQARYVVAQRVLFLLALLSRGILLAVLLGLLFALCVARPFATRAPLPSHEPSATAHDGLAALSRGPLCSGSSSRLASPALAPQLAARRRGWRTSRRLCETMDAVFRLHGLLARRLAALLAALIRSLLVVIVVLRRCLYPFVLAERGQAKLEPSLVAEGALLQQVL